MEKAIRPLGWHSVLTLQSANNPFSQPLVPFKTADIIISQPQKISNNLLTR
jgi:hypothetical protein